jgi:hypothetical protein
LISRLSGWLARRRREKLLRAHEELVLGRLYTALYPLERDGIKSLFATLEGFRGVVSEAHDAAESPERTALSLMIAILPRQLSATSPPERHAAILATLEESAAGPFQSVFHVLTAPSPDPLVTMVRNLTSRLRSWAAMGLIDDHDCTLLLHEISGAMRGQSPSERVAARLTAGLLESVWKAATPESRAMLEQLYGSSDGPIDERGGS